MSKYEIMVVLNGKIDEAAAKKASGELIATLGSVSDLKEQYLGLKELAYIIAGHDKGHYFLYNFEGSGENVAEFKRLAVINPIVLRQLVVNLEKDYAYKTTANAAKVAKNELKKVRHAEFVKRREEEIRNNPELAARYAARERRNFGPKRYGAPKPYGPTGSGGGGYTPSGGGQSEGNRG